MIRMRGHHLLCMKFYRGRGYSPEFVKNASRILRELKRNLDIEIIDGCDDICAACPHRSNLECRKPGIRESADKMDENVLKIFNLEVGSTVKPRKVAALIKRRINRQALQSICKDCEWMAICLEKLP